MKIAKNLNVESLDMSHFLQFRNGNTEFLFSSALLDLTVNSDNKN